MVGTVRCSSNHTCTRTQSLAFDVRVLVPLTACGVEESPAGCILRRHHAWVQPAQHGHHVVLDRTCNAKVLQELRPTEKPGESNVCFIYIFSKSQRQVEPEWDAHQPVLHVPEDRRAAEARGNAKVRLRLRKRRQKVTAAASVLPCDQLTGVSGGEIVPIWPITACNTEKRYFMCNWNTEFRREVNIIPVKIPLIISVWREYSHEWCKYQNIL